MIGKHFLVPLYPNLLLIKNCKRFTEEIICYIISKINSKKEKNVKCFKILVDSVHVVVYYVNRTLLHALVNDLSS